MARTWPLVGRDDELELIAEVLGRTSGPRSLVLAGTAGVGKTRLATEALEAAGRRGAPTARAIASRAASTIPLGAMAPLLPDSDAPPDSRLGLLRQAAAALAARASGREALVLGIDDAHLLDDASATLVHQLALEGSVRLLVTVRTGEPVPDAVALLWKDGLAERLELQRLARPEIEALAVAALEGPVDGALVQHLWTASEGNPLYLRELVLGAVEAGAVRRDGRLWRFHGPIGAPPRLVELVESRLAGLAADELEVVDLLAVGETLGSSALESVAGPGAVEALERRGLVTVTPDERRLCVRLAHPLHGEIHRRTLPTTRVRNVQRQLAALIEDAGVRRRDDVLRVAILRLDADGEAAADLLAEAARQAWFTYDIVLEERLARAAVAAGAGTPSLLLLAEILRWAGRHQEAEDLLRPVTFAEAEGDATFSIVCLTRAEVLTRGLDRYEDAIEVLDRGLEVVRDPTWRDELVAERASVRVFAGEVAEGLAVLEPLLERASGRAYVAAAAVTVPALAIAGRCDESLALAERSIAAALELGRQPSMVDPAVFMIGRCLALTYAGRLAEARAPAELGYEWSLTTGVPPGQAWFGMILGLVAVTAGNLAEAGSRFEEAAVLFREQHDRSNWTWCLSGAALVAAWRGDPLVARARLDEVTGARMRSVALMDVEIERAWAAVETVEGDLAAARARLAAAAELARAAGERSLEAAAQHDLARIAAPGSLGPAVAARLAELAGPGSGPLGAARAAHATAAAAADGAGLAAAADAFEALGARLFAAEAAGQASVAHAAAGRAGAATAAAARCRALAEACDGAWTPAVVRAEAATGPAAALTPRELEVARLAAAGRPNRQIADELFVSVRTVENQLQRAYTKLGVSGRAELRALLGGNEWK